jgi:hypothetical protein
VASQKKTTLGPAEPQFIRAGSRRDRRRGDEPPDILPGKPGSRQNSVYQFRVNQLPSELIPIHGDQHNDAVVHGVPTGLDLA